MNQKLKDIYEIIDEREIKELNASSMVLRHKKSGARLFLISNEDENKVFTIGFRTPAPDLTGVPHIMEHSVLCGSPKYPLKDPFVELVKGSLNTFLNAMTYTDKTVYPVASCNDQDFQNLMDVYLDAVLHPNIYINEKIFRQEGWHYELEQEEGPLTINGVVYNEMKGAYSSAESKLESEIARELFPDTTYSKDSGGNPDHIPELTYEQFLDFHRTYYHPSNSYIYLYGNMDMEEKLEYLDREYLKEFDAREVDSEIHMQKPFESMTEKEFFYPIAEDEEESEKTYLAQVKVTGDGLDPKLYIAFQILDYALLSAPGAPLKQALIDAGIGTDIYGGAENGVLQPTFSVIAKNTEKERKEEFLSIIQKVLTEAAGEGINKRSLEAGINYFEFKYREADFGSYPRGLMYGLQCFDSWLYDETDPYMHLEYEPTFAFLKEKKDEGYFEELIRTYLLDNPHGTVITMSPKKGMEQEMEKELEEKLAEHLSGLSMEERRTLIRETEELKAYQQEPTPKEDLEKIPMLKRSDIRKEVEPAVYKEKNCAGIPVLHTELFTGGITYFTLLFRADDITAEEVTLFQYFQAVLGSLSTEKHSYLELFNEINIETGGIGTNYGYYRNIAMEDTGRSVFTINSKVFSPKAGKALEFMAEIMNETLFDDDKRLKELTARYCSRMKQRIVSSGHRTAVVRAGAYDSTVSAFGDCTAGIAYYEFLCDLDKNFEERIEAVKTKLKGFAKKLFVKERMAVSCCCDSAGYEILEKAVMEFCGSIRGEVTEQRSMKEVLSVSKAPVPAYSQRNEAFKAASQVQYVARCGNFKAAGHEFTGALFILQVILSYDYLWIQVRVKGGAYGVMSGFKRSGDGYFVSYRDPNLGKTSEVFEGIPEYLEEFDADEREMTKYIIGTISSMDTPMNPAAKADRNLTIYLCDIPMSLYQKERDEVLNATAEDIRALAGITRAILDTKNICVIGGETKINQESELFREIHSLS